MESKQARNPAAGGVRAVKIDVDIGHMHVYIGHMANMKYFTECTPGQIVELSNVWHDGHNSTSAAHFHGVCAECGFWHVAMRKIERPGFASNHKCDGRCESAKGHKCECACGGKNHGKAA